MDIKQQVGENIAEIRRKRQWSQEELAHRSEMHRTYISGIERGVRNPTVTIIARIAEALEVEPAVLLRRAVKNS